MGFTITVVFNRENLKSNLLPIHLRITLNRKSDYLHTGIRINQNYGLANTTNGFQKNII